MVTNRPQWLNVSTRFEDKSNRFKIKVNSLKNILSIDKDKFTITIESSVTVDQCIKYLYPLGYKLAVTIEIGSATICGLAVGVGMST